ncbi:MAG: hypothetical protein ACJ8EL_19515 [Rhizomicrobium sp.]|jgi:hypothetical protein
MQFVKARFSHVRALLREHVWERWAGLGWLLYGFFVAFRDEIPNPGDKERWRIIAMIPHLSLAWWVAVALAILTAWIFEASFKRQRRSDEAFLALKKKYDALQEGPTVSFDPSYKIIEYGSSLFRVRISNNSHQFIENCQVFVAPLEMNGEEYPDDARVAVSDKFPLRRGDGHFASFVHFNEGANENAAFLPNYEFKDGWRETFPPHALRPAAYKLRVTAYSDNAAAGHLDLLLTHDGNEWGISCCP